MQRNESFLPFIVQMNRSFTTTCSLICCCTARVTCAKFYQILLVKNSNAQLNSATLVKVSFDESKTLFTSSLLFRRLLRVTVNSVKLHGRHLPFFHFYPDFSRFYSNCATHVTRNKRRNFLR